MNESKGAKRLRALFNRYSAVLARREPALANHFRCPLCRSIFARQLPLADIVAEEHVVPESLGGRITTLTCRRCNNASGSELEKHLVQWVRIDNGLVPMKVRVEVAGHQHGADLVVPTRHSPNAPISIAGVAKRSDPREVEKIKQAFDGGRARTITLRGTLGYVPHRTSLALIRAAYLLMFRTFGYDYIEDASAPIVTAQLSDPLAVHPILKGGIMPHVPSPPVGDSTVCVAVEGLAAPFWITLIRLNAEPLHMAAVALPAPGESGQALYEALSADGDHHHVLRALDPFNGIRPFRPVWNEGVREVSEP